MSGLRMRRRLAADLAAYRSGWWGQMAARVPGSLEMHTFTLFIWSFWRAGGLMLIGMAFYKWGILTAKRSGRFYGMMALVGLGLGIPVVAWGVVQNLAHDFEMLYSRFGVGYQFNYWGSLLVSAGYIGLVMWWSQTGLGARLQLALAAVGRMALSNYLLHTIVCITLFYGHGLGLYGSVERMGQIAVVLGIWLVQLVISPLWLGRYRYGPFEWLWRSLTYWQPQPLRRVVPV